MKPETKCRIIFIVALVILLVGIEVTGTQKEAQYAFFGLIIYFLIVGAVYGLVFCTRHLDRWCKRSAYEKYLRKRARDMANASDGQFYAYSQKALRQSLKKRPINYKQAEGRITRK